MPDNSSNQDLDLSFLYEIADGSNEFIIESIDMLLEQAPELLQSIGDSLGAGDWATAAASAHKLKPSAGFFGMLITQELLQEIEQLCKAGGQDPAEINDKFQQVKAYVEDSVAELTRIRAEKQAEL